MRDRPHVARRVMGSGARRILEIVGLQPALDALTAAKLNISSIASQAEAEAGVENTHYMTALRTLQAIQAQAGGAWVHYQTTAAVAALTVDFENGMTDSNIAFHVIEFNDVTFSSSSQLSAQFKKSGAYVTASNYYSSLDAQTGDTAFTTSVAAADSAVRLSNTPASLTNDRLSGQVILRGNLLTTAYRARVSALSEWINTSTGSPRLQRGAGGESTAAAVTGLRLGALNGSVTITGTFNHWGVPLL